jgi:hypothetical protein
MKLWKSEKYLKWVRTLPCAVCGSPAEPHHLRLGFAGIGQKSSDCLCIPLCRIHHDDFHKSPDYEYQLLLALRTIDKAFREGLFRLT